jgi:AAA domain-containing protein
MTALDANDIARDEGLPALQAMIDAAAQWVNVDNGVDEVLQESRKPWKILSSAEFTAGFVPPDYVLDGILQRRFVYSFTGKTGGGKTAILTLLTASVGLGRPIGPHAIEQGRVLYFAGENPDDVRMRWVALAQQMDFDIGAIDVHFIPGAFKISELMEQIKNEVAALGGVALIVVDTSAAYFEGDDENANKPAGDHARRFRDLTKLSGGPCVVVACHPPKNAADDNLTPRGGGAFIAEMDGNLTASKEGTVVEVHWQGKFRGPDFAPMTFLLRPVTHEMLKDSKGRLIPTVVAAHLSEAGQAELAATARTNENRALVALRDNDGASLAELARVLGWMLRSGAPNKMLVKRTLDKLRGAKLVSQDRGQWCVTEKGQKAANGDVTAAANSRRTSAGRNSTTSNGYDRTESQQ